MTSTMDSTLRSTEIQRHTIQDLTSFQLQNSRLKLVSCVLMRRMARSTALVFTTITPLEITFLPASRVPSVMITLQFSSHSVCYQFLLFYTSLAYCIFAHMPHRLYNFVRWKWTPVGYTRVWVYKNLYIFFIYHVSCQYRKNSNIICTILTKNRGLVAGVCIIHVN